MTSMMLSNMTLPPARPPAAGAARPADAANDTAPGAQAEASFAAWLGLAAPADAAPLPLEAGDAGALPALAESSGASGASDPDDPVDASSQDGTAALAPQDGAALPAMTLPMPMPMPITITMPTPITMPITMPMPITIPAAGSASAAGAAPAADAGAPTGVAGTDGRASSGVARAATVPLSPAAAAPAQPVAGFAFAFAQHASAHAAPAQPDGAPAPLARAKADAPVAPDTVAAPAATAATGASGFGVGAPAPAASQATPAAVVKLAGAPADWQQPLRQALGERLQVQLGRNADLAVIRLDPPMLGRIDISIRHVGGALEVNLSATNGEVLRQLHTISDSMRNDLAQRQYTEVAVNVAAAPRGGAPFGEQAGRQRHSGRDQDDTDPGRALAEAGNPASTFSLNGREANA